MTQEILTADPDWPYSKAKTAVLSAAAAVISESGPRAATLKNIAARAGITEPAIFRHFDGVDGLFGGLFSAFERVYQRIDEAFEVEERGIARLRSGLEAIVDIMAEGGDFSYILVHGEQVFRGYPDLYKKVGGYRLRNHENVMACVEEGVERGEIRADVDAESLATAALGMIHMTILSWIEERFRFDLRDRCELRWDTIERMFTPALSSRSVARRSSNTKTSSTKTVSSKASAALKTSHVPVAASTNSKTKVRARAKAGAVSRRG